MANKLTRAAAYVRGSGRNPKTDVERQSSAIDAYASKHHIEIVRAFTDIVRRNQVAPLKGMNELIAAVESGTAGLAAIVVEEPRRWVDGTKNADEVGYLKGLCRRARVTIHYCSIPSELQLRLRDLMRDSIDHEYREELRRRRRAGRSAR